MGKKRKQSCEDLGSHVKKGIEEFEKEYDCESCECKIYGGIVCVFQHLQSARHKRVMHVYYLSDYFKQFDIDWNTHNPT